MRDEAQRALEEAVELAPVESTWGYFFYSDRPPVAGGGAGGFVWFDTRDEMLDFIAEHQVHVYPSPSSSGWAAVASQVCKTVEQVRSGELSEAVALSRLNTTLTGYSQIEWWGQFRDLLAGDQVFPAKVRVWFREVRDVRPSAKPVEAEEMGLFREALKEYGL